MLDDRKVEVVCSEALEFLKNWDVDKCGRVDNIYIDPPYMTDRTFVTTDGDFAYDDKFTTQSYGAMISPILWYSKGILADGGHIVVQCDWRADYIIKGIGHQVFGQENNVANIIWHYSSGGASRKGLSRKYDTLLVWSNGPAKTFNLMREPYATPNVEDRAGFNPEGRIMHDVWNDIGIVSTTAKERVGWPTQKPLKLLDRVIKLYSNEGDIWLDFFAGSGTTAVAALQANRRAIAVDVSEEAVDTIRQRLIDNKLDT